MQRRVKKERRNQHQYKRGAPELDRPKRLLPQQITPNRDTPCRYSMSNSDLTKDNQSRRKHPHLMKDKTTTPGGRPMKQARERRTQRTRNECRPS